MEIPEALAAVVTGIPSLTEDRPPLYNETINSNDDGLLQTKQTTLTNMTAEESFEAAKYAAEHREICNLGNDQSLMIAIAFVQPEELKMFQLFPFVMHIDCTADTNVEQRPLLTVCGRTSHGKMFTILRA